MDVEGIAYVQAKWAKIRGLISGKTFEKVANTLNMIRGENESLKTQVGRMESELEDLRNRNNAIEAECAMLRDELAKCSIKKVDSEIADIKPDAVPEVIDAIESGEATV